METSTRRNDGRRAHALLAGCALFALGGCGGAADAPVSGVTVDTVAGVVHVRNPREVPVWRAEPFVRIGSAGAAAAEARPDEFGRIRAAVADEAGEIYVADVQTAEIRVFGPDGAYLRSIGHEGQGPVVTPAPAGVAIAWSAEYAVAFVSPSGDTTRVVHRVVDRVPVTDAEWEAGTEGYREGVERHGRGACDPPSPERPSTKPPLIRLHFDQEGRLVAERNIEGGTAFDLYDHEGRIRATVPASAHDPDTPPYFRDDRMYVVERDSLDVPYVVAYRLVG